MAKVREDAIFITALSTQKSTLVITLAKYVFTWRAALNSLVPQGFRPTPPQNSVFNLIFRHDEETRSGNARSKRVPSNFSLCQGQSS